MVMVVDDSGDQRFRTLLGGPRPLTKGVWNHIDMNIKAPQDCGVYRGRMNMGSNQTHGWY